MWTDEFIALSRLEIHIVLVFAHMTPKPHVLNFFSFTREKRPVDEVVNFTLCAELLPFFYC